MSKKSRVLVLVLATVCAFTFLLTGCGQTPGQTSSSIKETGNEIAPYKFSPPITVTACQMSFAGCEYSGDDNADNNIWTRGIAKDLGINIKFDFQPPDSQAFEVKVNTGLASGNLPELLGLYTSLFFRSLDADKLADITDAYEKYACDEIKADAKLSNERAIKSASKNNRLYAVCPGVGTGASVGWNYGVTWYRQDWLNKLNLKVPSTIDEFWNVTKTISKKMTTPKKEVYGFWADNTLSSFTTIGNAYGAYTDIWIENANGDLQRGETSEAWIPVLKKLREYYTQGILDPEFVNCNRSTIAKKATNGQIGVAPIGHYAPDDAINGSVATDKNAHWVSELMPSAVNPAGTLNQCGSRVATFVSMNKTSSHPEVAPMLESYIYKQLTYGDPKYYNDGNVDTYRYIQGFYISSPDNRIKAYEDCSAVVNGTKDASTLGGNAKSYYEQMLPWVKKKDPSGWSMYAIYGPNGSFEKVKEVADKNLAYKDRLWGPELPNWKKYGSDLASQRLQYFMQIICDPDTYPTVEQGFNEFVKSFNASGGTESTQEINDWWKQEGKAGFYDQ